MNTLRLALVLAFTSSAAVVGCSVETDNGRTDGGDAGRGLGKADGVFGSCQIPGTDEDNCGGPSHEGNCWCDDLCTDYGDCCADKVDVCGGDGTLDPTPKLCLTDSTCGDGQFCDHSECLSGCPDGGICPAVCFGQCVDGDDECDIDPAVVFCPDDHIFSVEECGCVPIEDEPCHTLGEEECNETDDCQWVTHPGFPGPISMCEDADEPTGCEPPDDSWVAVSGEELAADVDAFLGQKIWLTGDSKPGFPICTQLACSIENPCCNSCGAGIEMDLGPIDLEMSGIGCGGNNCEVMNNCEYGFGETFSAWGTLKEDFGLVRLEIDGHCGVE